MSRSRTRTLVVSAAFLASAIVMLMLLVLQWRTFESVEDTAALVQRKIETQQGLTSFGNSVVDAESGQRGFLLTGIPAYLKPYQMATEAIPRELAGLKASAAENPEQLSRIALLDTLSEAKLDELSRTVKLTNEGNRDSALKIVRTNVGDSLMRSIRIGVRAAIHAEDSVLTASEVRLEEDFVRRREISEFLAVILAVVMGIIALVLRRLRRYEDLVTLCGWTKAVNYEGEWLSFEEYLRRRFGLSTTHGISPDALAELESSLEAKSRRGPV